MKCKFCAEEIQDEAVFCRFCSRRIKGVPWKPIMAAVMVIALSLTAVVKRREIEYFLRYTQDLQREIMFTIRDINDGIRRLKDLWENLNS